MEVIARTRSVGNSLLEAPRAAIDRGRSNPRLAAAAIIGALLLIAWVAWAIYVTSDKGANAGLGVVLGWPVLLAALALIAFPFAGLYFLLRSLSTSDDGDEESTTSYGSDDAEAETESEEEPGTESEDDADEEDAEADEDAEGGGGGGEEEEEEREETDPDEEPPSGEKARASGRD